MVGMPGTGWRSLTCCCVGLLLVQVLLQAAAAAIQGRHPSYDVYECWQALFDKYCELWDQQHGLLALLPPSGQWAGCYRAGGLLGLLRPQAAVEARRGGPGAEGGGVGRAWERGVVRQCLGVVRELLGGPCLTLMTQLVMSGGCAEGQRQGRVQAGRLQLPLGKSPIARHTLVPATRIAQLAAEPIGSQARKACMLACLTGAVSLVVHLHQVYLWTRWCPPSSSCCCGALLWRPPPPRRWTPPPALAPRRGSSGWRRGRQVVAGG